MGHVRIEYTKNIISRTVQGMWQEMSFAVSVDNLAYRKDVVIHWCGEDGVWHEQAAEYCHTIPGHTVPNRGERWLATVRCLLTPEHSLPGNILFKVCYRCEERTFWDDNHGNNYKVDADSGVIVYRDVPVQHLFFNPLLQGGKVSLPIHSAVQSSLKAKNVRIHWSTDNWKTSQTAPCFKSTNHWEIADQSAARNPNRYGWEIWTGRLPVQQTYRVEYSIECETDEGIFWDNCGGSNYQSRRSTMRVLALNLHCYQEEDQDRKFRQIARAIKQLDIDLVCLQEVAENWNDGRGDWNSNAARVINSYLPCQYHLHTDYSHLGFDRYREGVAILSRYEFSMTDSRYVSDTHDIYDIHSRRVVMAQIHVPYFGPVNLFSAHLSWPEDGFYNQFNRLQHWANELHGEHVAATLLCGDFNIKAYSQAYAHIVNTREYEDQYLKVLNRHAFDRVYRDRVSDVCGAMGDDGRIDFIFLKNGSQINLLDGQELFTDQSYGRVSDHTGYCVEFELK
ncbi:MAG: endonuclease/exonuclease/phosphatase family protein [Psychromonas sp.]